MQTATSAERTPGVAQTFQSAVSPTFQSAGCPSCAARSNCSMLRRLENLRYGRLESLRYGFGGAQMTEKGKFKTRSRRRRRGLLVWTMSPSNLRIVSDFEIRISD